MIESIQPNDARQLHNANNSSAYSNEANEFCSEPFCQLPAKGFERESAEYVSLLNELAAGPLHKYGYTDPKRQEQKGRLSHNIKRICCEGLGRHDQCQIYPWEHVTENYVQDPAEER